MYKITETNKFGINQFQKLFGHFKLQLNINKSISTN